ncbi:hypothetical protein SAMN02910409_1909 [Prevotellaceae bacterium HUN156]|nr:hypothetical protein SAMN02910409_1909 [Prevotellaceae bacterium HUN156]
MLIRKKVVGNLEESKEVRNFATEKEMIMTYTKETLVINNPSEKLLKAVEELRKQKLANLEKLRNMKSEEFSRRVILS